MKREKFEVEKIRQDFPLIAGAGGVRADCCMGRVSGRQVAQEGLVYLDNAATMQKPRMVLDAVRNYYETCNANPLRGMYDLSVAATEVVFNVRKKIAKFIGAEGLEEVIFNSGATEGLNMVAMWRAALASDDEIVVGRGEHHSNLLPWVRIAEATGAQLKIVDCVAGGAVDEERFLKALTPNTKVVALSLVGNAMGGRNNIKKLFGMAHDRNKYALCVLDAAQAVAHERINVRNLGADVMAFSGHKMGAPMGIGVLYVRREILEQATPVWLGGEAVEWVRVQKRGVAAGFGEIPQRFEAGTQNVGGIVGLGAAVDYLMGVGIRQIATYEDELIDLAVERLEETGVAEVYGAGSGIVAFNVKGVHPHDAATMLALEGVAVRAGWQCAQPLLEGLKIGPVVRASVSFYNTPEEIEKLVQAVVKVAEALGAGGQSVKVSKNKSRNSNKGAGNEGKKGTGGKGKGGAGRRKKTGS